MSGCAAGALKRGVQGEEARTAPGGAGDGAGDGGQARISRALPVEAIGDDGDGVALALIVANEHRAGLEAAPGRAAMPLGLSEAKTEVCDLLRAERSQFAKRTIAPLPFAQELTAQY